MQNPSSLPTKLVTVTSRDYLPGTQVMLHSFLRTNQWFDGSIIVLENDLRRGDKAALQANFPSVTFPGVSTELDQAIDRLVAEFPKLAGRRTRFLSLDAFQPESGDTALFLDSDLLFLEDIADIADMAAMDGPIIACGDRSQLVGTHRDPVSMEETDTPSSQGFSSFNAGLMILRQDVRTQSVWQELLAHLTPEAWKDVTTDHTDQAVYNRVFGDRVVLADPRFNYLIGHAGQLRGSADVTLKSAKVLHFNGHVKPWLFHQHLPATASDASFIAALGHWNDAYRRFLTAHHFNVSAADSSA
ncbi:glycosyltransferase [Pontixanthobacter aquaemixtae]|uniref:Glycosyl transferase family 8 n=1 Tax=Pontixanthobacter aquaemixtae TaxID=1958940 RepID=A0A844ZZF9_9SPHN|nr:glycosyltransferase [Pontixanthobacter aquaemixtae]MXO90819.1 hypothetical protein [Pontixanthobacter aquaemixtae]